MLGAATVSTNLDILAFHDARVRLGLHQPILWCHMNGGVESEVSNVRFATREADRTLVNASLCGYCRWRSDNRRQLARRCNTRSQCRTRRRETRGKQGATVVCTWPEYESVTNAERPQTPENTPSSSTPFIRRLHLHNYFVISQN